MAFGALGVAPGCAITVDDAECVDVSFPGFWDALAEVTPGEDMKR
jgi:5-enolpyruvylshikimate-3-phosphate synthase